MTGLYVIVWRNYTRNGWLAKTVNGALVFDVSGLVVDFQY
jgi:hypothetical protein